MNKSDLYKIFKSGGYFPRKNDILLIFIHPLEKTFVLDGSGNSNPDEINGIRLVIPGSRDSFHEHSLDQFLHQFGINKFIKRIGDRFYISRLTAPDELKNIFCKIPWLKDTHRSAIHEISLKHKNSGFMKEIEHHQTLSIFYHRDFKTLEQKIEEATLQIRRIPNFNERKFDKDASEGSAFAFRYGEDQYLATAKHVTENKGERFEIFHATHGKFYAKITSLSNYDIQILKLEKDFPIPVLTLGDSDLIELTDEIYVSGYPHKLGVRPTISLGHISKINATYENEDGLIQISSAAINPKNSGGPILNDQGEVIGILTSRAKKNEDGLQNIAFAEPVNRLHNLLKGL